MMLKILEHRIFYGESRFHAAFPSITRFNDGNLLLAFRRARDAHWLIAEQKRQSLDLVSRVDHIDSRSHIMLMELDKLGKQQIGELDMLPIDPEAGDQDPSLLVLPEQQVFVASFSWYPLPFEVAQHVQASVTPAGEDEPGCRFLFWGAHTSLRNRQSAEWIASHRYIQPDGGYGFTLSPAGEKKIAGSVRGQALYKDQKIFIPLFASDTSAALFVSVDKGDSWNFVSTIARDSAGKITFLEPALCEDSKGGMVCFMRTTGADDRLATSYSPNGDTWSEPQLHKLVGHPFNPLVLKDGRVLLSYGYRHKPYGIRARLLADARQDPDTAEEIIIRDDGLCADVGYPWGVQLDDGNVLLVYYMTSENGMRHIAGTLLEVV